ncbi:Pkinase-domain-containing protein [Microthyrium microscopicum]|uniref:non-specific serine/threonine protein kinase n=1 Tax=Microthyrium microscopicum TaxID=703497 RepID=A0A6A6UJQ1_9PEZI|nr:Pkinase-domain-containing protein [Microthyrium microscopicum]
MADTQPASAGQHPEPAVRFSSVTQEISPSDNTTDESIHLVNTITEKSRSESLTEEQKKELKDLSVSMQQSRLQSARMDKFVFEPVSLPASRVPSAGSSTQIQSHSALSPRSSPVSRPSSQNLLTPADSGSKDESITTGRSQGASYPVTPQESPLPDIDGKNKDTKPSAAAEARALARPKSLTEISGIPVHPKQPPTQLAIPRGDSNPTSGESSPLGTPRELPSGAQSPYSRPFTPTGDPNDPYSRQNRPPQSRNVDSIDARFVFGKERPRSALFASEKPKADSTEKRASIFGAGRKDSVDSGKNTPHGHHSMSDLKRFFRFGGSKKDKKEKSTLAPPTKEKRKSTAVISSHAPSRSQSSVAIPFADDHGLEAKYGKFERILGSGAGGSVRLMKRQDGVTFAVKQFRERHAWETEKAYNKKITAEFCIGSTLHHGNIIEAMDIINEKGRWYEVMEYAPFDLFAIVMTGKMSREEVACCMLQIVNGVAYIHSMGLAHRDLKLDNVVVNEHGIMKIIDFGSAHVFQYPFEGGVVMAEGVVGSDPYLAPEVFTQKTYEAQKVDIWSLAIIFCCMSLRRFPWKCPKTTDNSFKLFITQPTDEELKHPLYPQRPSVSEPSSRPQSSLDDGSATTTHHHHHRDHSSSDNTPNTTNSTNPSSTSTAPSSTTPSSNDPSSKDTERPRLDSASTLPPSTTTAAQQNITIKGPWRLLRLLPRETRHIVGRMLELEPTQRASLDEITADPWVAKTPFCKQEVAGEVCHADGHVHTLEGGGGDDKR